MEARLSALTHGITWLHSVIHSSISFLASQSSVQQLLGSICNLMS